MKQKIKVFLYLFSRITHILLSCNGKKMVFIFNDNVEKIKLKKDFQIWFHIDYTFSYKEDLNLKRN